VTTHKIDLLRAARDLFDTLGPYAIQTNEVSSIAKDGGKLTGRATDPLAGALSLDALLGSNYFARTGGEVLLLGAGGAAVALSLHLPQKARPGDRPRRIVAVDLSRGRLAQLDEMVSQFNTDIQFDYVENDKPQHNDELMAALPPGSVVINATGMGKDTAGSPITDTGLFPKNGVAWELNYRGQLDFLHQARAQQSTRNLAVADGWDYFIHGWSQVIAHVLHLEISPPLFDTLSQLAAEIR
jgi:shikimate dehydrogenase